MKKIKTKSFALLLVAFIVVVGFLRTPVRVKAADLAVIRLNELVSDAAGAPDYYAWSYDGATRILTLSATNGQYRIENSNADISVVITGDNATVDLASASFARLTCNSADATVNMSSANVTGINVGASRDATFNLVGTNTVNAGGNVALLAGEQATVEFSSTTGGRIALSSTSGSPDQGAVNLGNNAELIVSGNARVDIENTVGVALRSSMTNASANTIEVGANAELNITGYNFGIYAGSRFNAAVDGTLNVLATRNDMLISASEAIADCVPGNALYCQTGDVRFSGNGHASLEAYHVAVVVADGNLVIGARITAELQAVSAPVILNTGRTIQVSCDAALLLWNSVYERVYHLVAIESTLATWTVTGPVEFTPETGILRLRPYAEFASLAEVTVDILTGEVCELIAPPTLKLTVGYKATTSPKFTVTGTGPVAVEVMNPADLLGKVTWDPVNERLIVAAGLPEGVYTVQLRPSNPIGVSNITTYSIIVGARNADSPNTGDVTGTVAWTMLLLSSLPIIYAGKKRNKK